MNWRKYSPIMAESNRFCPARGETTNSTCSSTTPMMTFGMVAFLTEAPPTRMAATAKKPVWSCAL